MIYGINLMLVITLFVFMQIWRWSHSGEVCSGKYMADPTDHYDDKRYLILEGIFLKWVLIAIYCIFGIGFTTCCCVALFFT